MIQRDLLWRHMSEKKLFRVLSLDSGGSKGFYTLGILREIEALVKYQRFDLIFGTSSMKHVLGADSQGIHNALQDAKFQAELFRLVLSS